MLEPLEAYFRLLSQWNAKINLTALPLDPPTDETFDRLLVEPLAASKQIPDVPAVWYDLGSGGGSPAIPLKIARTALRLTMIESRERKSAFLREVVRVVGLVESTVATERFEETAAKVENGQRVDLITVRAVKIDQVLINTAERLLSPKGRLVLFRPAHTASSDPPGFKRLSTVALIDTPPSFLSIYERTAIST
jgi:16S rRNA (guanine527-N7)-methyltransferase